MSNSNSSEPLRGVWAKLDRAEEVLNLVNSEVIAFFNGYEQPIRVERDDDQLRDTFFFNIPDPPPLRISILIGDCLYNLRSSLDHLVYALAVAHTGKSKPPKAGRLSFPITTDSFDFACAAKNIHRVIPADALTEIEWLQPYNRNLSPSPSQSPGETTFNLTERHPLNLINRWSNVDKHRTLHAIFGSIVGSFGDVEVTYVHEYGGVALEYGTQISHVIYKSPPPYSEMDVPIEFVPDVRLDEVAAGWGVRSEFGIFVRRIRNDVVPRFSGFFE